MKLIYGTLKNWTCSRNISIIYYIRGSTGEGAGGGPTSSEAQALPFIPFRFKRKIIRGRFSTSVRFPLELKTHLPFKIIISMDHPVQFLHRNWMIDEI